MGKSHLSSNKFLTGLNIHCVFKVTFTHNKFHINITQHNLVLPTYNIFAKNVLNHFQLFH